MDTLQRVEVRSTKDLRAWLSKNHGQMQSVWLVTYKKSTPEYHVSWYEVVTQVLCFGWIDSVPRKLDEHRTMRLISPRKPNSNWSAINKKKVGDLIAKNLMKPAGLRAVERAKRDGSWFFLDEVEGLIVPKDLIAELIKYPSASINFELFPKSAKKAILEWIKSAKQPATRESRIVETAFLASENVRAHQY